MLRTSQLRRVMIRVAIPMIQPSRVYRMPWHNKNQNRLCKLASPPKICSRQIKPAKNNKAVNKRKRASKRRPMRTMRRLQSQYCLRQIKKCRRHSRLKQLIVLRRVSRCPLDSLLSAIIKKYRTSNGTT